MFYVQIVLLGNILGYFKVSFGIILALLGDFSYKAITHLVRKRPFLKAKMAAKLCVDCGFPNTHHT